MSRKSIFLLVLAGVAGLLLLQGTFIVDQTERAIVLQLGKPVGDVRGPGLHFKIPFVQNSVKFDYRVLEYDASPNEVITRDKKNMVVDNYSRWRIEDPLLFYRTVRTIDAGRSRLDEIVYSEMREQIGRYTLIEIVAEKRSHIMAQVTERSNKILDRYGINVLDVRIKRADLPPENQRAIFERMRAERQRQAKQYRSEGREAGKRITTEADRKRAVMLADAERQAEIMRGEGDAEATRIYGEALNLAPDFYEFTRSLEAYRKSFKDGGRIILTPESEFMRSFQ